MAEVFQSAPSASEIYAPTTTGPARVVTSCSQPSLGSQAGTNCSTPSIAMVSESAWYEASWTTPAAYLIIVYVVTSACIMLLLFCNGYITLNLSFSYAAADQRELRRRRRNSQRMEDWIERERRDAEPDMDADEEYQAPDQTLRFYQGQRHEPAPTPNAGLDAIQHEAMQQRRENDARVLARLHRAGLL